MNSRDKENNFLISPFLLCLFLELNIEKQFSIQAFCASQLFTSFKFFWHFVFPSFSLLLPFFQAFCVFQLFNCFNFFSGVLSFSVFLFDYLFPGILCGENFGFFTRQKNLLCADCNKAVCTKVTLVTSLSKGGVPIIKMEI